MYIPDIADNLEIMTDDRVKDFVIINFAEYSKSTRGILCSKLSEETNLLNRFIFFVIKPDGVEKMLRWRNQVLLIMA